MWHHSSRLCSETRREFWYSSDVILLKASPPTLCGSDETVCRDEVVGSSPKRGRAPGAFLSLTNLVLWFVSGAVSNVTALGSGRSFGVEQFTAASGASNDEV